MSSSEPIPASRATQLRLASAMMAWHACWPQLLEPQLMFTPPHILCQRWARPWLATALLDFLYTETHALEAGAAKTAVPAEIVFSSSVTPPDASITKGWVDAWLRTCIPDALGDMTLRRWCLLTTLDIAGRLLVTGQCEDMRSEGSGPVLFSVGFASQVAASPHDPNAYFTSTTMSHVLLCLIDAIAEEMRVLRIPVPLRWMAYLPAPSAAKTRAPAPAPVIAPAGSIESAAAEPARPTLRQRPSKSSKRRRTRMTLPPRSRSRLRSRPQSRPLSTKQPAPPLAPPPPPQPPQSSSTMTATAVAPAVATAVETAVGTAAPTPSCDIVMGVCISASGKPPAGAKPWYCVDATLFARAETLPASPLGAPLMALYRDAINRLPCAADRERVWQRVAIKLGRYVGDLLELRVAHTWRRFESLAASIAVICDPTTDPEASVRPFFSQGSMYTLASAAVAVAASVSDTSSNTCSIKDDDAKPPGPTLLLSPPPKSSQKSGIGKANHHPPHYHHHIRRRHEFSHKRRPPLNKSDDDPGAGDDEDADDDNGDGVLDEDEDDGVGMSTPKEASVNPVVGVPAAVVVVATPTTQLQPCIVNHIMGQVQMLRNKRRRRETVAQIN